MEFGSNTTFLQEKTEAVNQLCLLKAIAVAYGFNPEAEILSFDGNKIEKISYEDTESYAVTEMFINNREVLIKHLLE